MKLTPTGNSLTVDLNEFTKSHDITMAAFSRQSRLSEPTVRKIIDGKPVCALTIEKARRALTQKQPAPLADRMALWMADAGLTQEQAAERADVTQQVIHKLVNGITRNPCGKVKRKIEAAIKADFKISELDARLSKIGDVLRELVGVFGDMASGLRAGKGE